MLPTEAVLIFILSTQDCQNLCKTHAQKQSRMFIHVQNMFTVNLQTHNTLSKSPSNQDDGLQYNLINTVHQAAINFY